MSPRLACAIVATLVFGTAPRSAPAQTTDDLRRELDGVEVLERLGAAVPAGARFVDDAERPVRMGDYAGRPILLSLNYSDCPMLCSLQLGGLAKAIQSLGGVALSGPAAAFEIVTVSVDPDEPPAQALRAKQQFVRLAGGGDALQRRWHFLTGAQPEIRAVADAVGFHYQLDPATGEFRHQATLIVLTPDGRVSSYLHGIEYRPADLAAALDRAAAGVVLTAMEQSGVWGATMACFAYDPNAKPPLGLVLMRLGGGVTLAFLLSLLVVHWRREHRRRKAEQAS